MKTFRLFALGAGVLLGGFLFSFGGEAQAAPLSGLNADLDGMFIATGTVTTVQTSVANNATANDTWLATSTQSSAYFGMNYVFNQLTFNVGTAGTVGAVTWEYCSAQSATCTTWTALSPTDGTNSFKTAGTNDVTFSIPSDPVWVTSTIFDGAGRYYVRARMSTGYTVYPLATQISATEFNLKIRVADELGTGLTGLLNGAFAITNCDVTTKYAFREVGTGLYELGLVTQGGGDVNCDYTATSSGYVRSTAAATGNLSTNSVTGTAASLPFAYKVNSVAVESISSTLASVTVSAGNNSSIACTESGSAWYCPVPVSHTDLKIQTVKDGYVTASSSLFIADRTAETDTQKTGTVTNVQFAVKVTVTTDGTITLDGATVVAGDSLGVTCTEFGSTSSYYCAVPIAHTGVTAQATKSGYFGSGTYTDRTANAGAQSLASIIAGATGGGGGSSILSVSKDATPKQVHAGSNVLYTVTLSNGGSLSAENVVVTDTLPGGFTFSDGTQTKTVSTIALFAPGPTRIIAYAATVGSSVAPGAYWNTVMVTNASNSVKLYAQALVEVLPGGTESGAPAPNPSPSPSPSPTVTQLPQPYGEKAAVTLYRIEGDPRVYAVVNNQRRHIPNPAAFSANGFVWGAIRVFGAGETPQYKEAVLLRAKGDPKVYSIQGKVKTWIKTADEFVKGGYKWKDVVEVPGIELTAYTTSGASGAASQGAVVVLKPGVIALNVRSSPSLTSTRIGRMVSGQTATVLATDGVWFEVRLSSGLEGWAHGAYLREK